MTAEVVSIADIRARRLPVSFVPPKERAKAEATAQLAADRWVADSLLLAAQEISDRLWSSTKPLDPHERTKVMLVASVMLPKEYVPT